ncbi:unnamed protein product [Heterobilharzia americana]|nr:unnamed protein product [Heterobilharzia americana]
MILFRPIIRKEVHLFRWSPLVLISFGILLGLSLVLIKPFQHRKPLNFFMLFTTVTILSMGLGLLFTDADAVEMLVSWIITLLISGLFFIIGFIGRFDITQRATWYLIYVVTTYSVGTIGAIMLFILKKRSVALLLQGVSAVSGFAPLVSYVRLLLVSWEFQEVSAL